MSARIRKGRSIGTKIILFSSILALNFSGVSYAYWTDGLNIKTTLATGHVDPTFCSQYDIKIIRDNEKGGEPIDLKGISISFEDEYTMVVEGKVDSKYKALIQYCVVNNGTVPVKYAQNPQELSKGVGVQDGLNVIVDQQSGILDPEEAFYSDNGWGNGKLHLEAKEEGEYTFELKLPFDQWDI